MGNIVVNWRMGSWWPKFTRIVLQAHFAHR